MARLAPISKDRHAGKSWRRFSTFSFAAGTSAVPLVAREVPHAARSMPIAFLREPDGFTLAGVLSLVPGQNLFVGPEGKWLGDYVPSEFRCYPFRFAPAPGEKGEMMFCVDEGSGLIGDAGDGEPFFDENGELTRSVQEIFDFLKQMAQNRAGTKGAVSAMAESGIITEWNVKVNLGGQEKYVKGLYTIDEVKLTNLDDQEFLKLRKAFALPIVYSQLLSMGNIRVLQKLSERHEKESAAPDTDLGDFSLRL